MERLSEALDADVAAHDSCGFGLTERTRDVKRYTRSSDARACAAVLREVGVSGKSVTLVGHSLGGVSAALASAGDARVDHVVLVAPAIVGGKVTPIDKRGGAMMQLPMFARLVFACVAATLKTMSWTLLVATKPLLVVFLRSIVRSKEFWRRGLCAAIDPSRVSTMSEGWVDGYRLPKVVRDWESGMFRVVLASIAAANSPREIWRDALAAARRTTAPTTLEAEDAVNALVDSGAKILIVHGESDKIVPASNSVALAKTLGAELKLIPRCGHMPHEESCEEFVDVVRDFIVRTST
ncbi:Alpha/Beta hydrolase protein [Ostreococcus tauri]|uniref:Alpha/Beta hydrolase protein n=3 Tax=Ostreococcus tauri TaxID=70448 RepID=A0A1Y5IC84_OSTTA|nr:Alpha/Beta hydrolase protein [Ostreococcus tauri]